MVFLNWKELPWFWHGSEYFLVAMVLVALLPGLLAYVFGRLAFGSRVSGVYFSIMSQAMTYALMLAFFRNEMGFGGNNGLTDFKTLLGFELQTDGMRPRRRRFGRTRFGRAGRMLHDFAEYAGPCRCLCPGGNRRNRQRARAPWPALARRPYRRARWRYHGERGRRPPARAGAVARPFRLPGHALPGQGRPVAQQRHPGHFR